MPVIFSRGDQAGNVSEDPSSALDDGQRVGLAAVGQRADQEAQSSVNRADGHLVLHTVGRQIPQSTQQALESRLLQGKPAKMLDA